MKKLHRGGSLPDTQGRARVSPDGSANRVLKGEDSLAQPYRHQGLWNDLRAAYFERTLTTLVGSVRA